MRAGALRHRVDLERPVSIQSATGDPVITWTVIATNVPAEIAPLSTREFIAGAAGPVASQITARIKIRYRTDIDATMRIKHYADGRGGAVDLYNIAGILPDQKSGREYLTLPVTRGVNDG